MPATHGQLNRAIQDAHAFYRRHVEASWVPHHLNRRNLYAQMESAEIGYAPAGWTVTTDHLRGLGHPDDRLLEAGLARRIGNGQVVDFFRDRLMVPLSTRQTELVGFIGRCGENAGTSRST